MAIIRQLQPSATTSNDFTIVGEPSGHAFEAVKNGDVASYLQGSAGSAAVLEVDDGDYIDERIAQVRVQMSVMGGLSGQVMGKLRVDGTDGLSVFATEHFPSSPGEQLIGFFWNVNPDTTTEWTGTAMNALQLVLQCTDGGPIKIWSASVIAQVHKKPVVRIQSQNTYVQPRNPLITWTATAAGDAPVRYRVRIFTQAVAEGGGFDPETSTKVYDSGVQIPAGNRHQVPASAGLDYDTVYYVYVESATSFPAPLGPELWWSEWAGKSFKTFVQPEVTITSPVGTTDVAQPTVTYTISSGTERSTLVRWYDYDIVGSGDNPDVVKPIAERWGVGGEISFAGGHLLLKNGGTYWVGARSTMFNVTTPWSFNEIVATLDAPDAPTLDATPNPDSAYYDVVVSFTAGAIPVGGMVVERLDSDGIWRRVRGACILLDNEETLEDGTFNFQDAEVEFNASVSYRAYLIGRGEGGLVTSNTVELFDAPELAVQTVWLGSVTSPGLAIHFLESDTWLDRAHRKRRGFYEPLDRDLPVSFRQRGKGEQFTMGFVTLDEGAGFDLEQLLDEDSTVVVRTADRRWFTECNGDYTIRQALWDALHNRGERALQYSVPFQEIEFPPVELSAGF